MSVIRRFFSHHNGWQLLNMSAISIVGAITGVCVLYSIGFYDKPLGGNQSAIVLGVYSDKKNDRYKVEVIKCIGSKIEVYKTVDASLANKLNEYVFSGKRVVITNDGYYITKVQETTTNIELH